MLLGRRVVRELAHGAAVDVDDVDVVLLVAAGVLAERDRAVVACPREARAQRTLRLAVPHLPYRLGTELRHIQLPVAELVPGTGSPLTIPGGDRREGRWK